MSALNFPDNPADVGNVYVGDNGITYDYINGKWRGRTASGSGSGNGWQLTSSTAVLSLAADGKLTLPNGGTIAGAPPVPTIISLSNADWGPANDTYTRADGVNPPRWTAVGNDTYIEYSDSMWAVYNPAFNQAIYVNHGSLTAPFVQWETNPPLGSVAPTGSYTISPQWSFGADNELTLPSGGRLGYAGKGWTGLDGGYGQPVSLTSLYPSSMYSGCITITPGNGVAISTYGDGTGQTGGWTFGNDGYLQIQNDVRIASSSTVVCPINADTVIYSSTNQWQMTFKILIKVEGFETTDTVPWDTQSTEMIIARSFRNNQVVASVYGVVHTSINPLATFTAQWNAVTSKVEILCRPTSSTYPVWVRTFATEITSSD